MTKQVYGDDYNTSFMHLGVDDWVFTANSTVIVAAGTAIAFDSTGATIQVLGGVFANETAIALTGTDTTATIGKTGSVFGGTIGLRLDGTNVSLTNFGHIYSTSNDISSGAVYLAEAGATFTNSGKVVGAGNGVYVEPPTARVVNERGGVIVGDVGMRFSDAPIAVDNTTTENYGTIRGTGGVAFHGGFSRDTLVNHGRIVGDIDLGVGTDTVDTRGGTITGNIYGGFGIDTLITDTTRYTLVETEDGGNQDAIESTVSYVLPDHVEWIILLGKKNINGTGTDATNTLFGNKGDNILDGKDGPNWFFGSGGEDRLIGGTGRDVFGLSAGYDHDTAVNFSVGEDVIGIYELGVTEFEDMASHIRQKGADTWIAFGKDALILKNVDSTLLGAGDFIWDYELS